MAKRGRPCLQLSVSDRLERRRAQLARSQRKSRARRRDPGGCRSSSSLPPSSRQCVSPHEILPSFSEDPTTGIAAPTAGTWQQPGAESPAMNPQPPESHRDDFSWTEAVLDNSPASPDLRILERSEAHPLSRVLESPEYECHTPLELDTADPSVFLPNLDDSEYPSCSMLPGSDSVFPAMLDNSFCTSVSTSTNAKEATLLPWLVPEGNPPNSLPYPETGLDPPFTTTQGENHHISPEQSYHTAQGSHRGDLISDNWASSPFIPSSGSFALDAPLWEGQEWDTILQSTARPFAMRRGFDDCRTVRLILTFAV